MVVMLYNIMDVLNTMNCALKNDYDGTFYVTCILHQLKKLENK